jgi:hypothetical protein
VRRIVSVIAIITALAIAVSLTGVALLAPARAATSLTAQTREFRVDAMTLLRGYERELTPRLAPAERQELSGVIGQANRSLTRLTAATRLLDQANARNKPARKAQAMRAFADAKTAEANAIARVQPLAVREMGIMEMLKAKADLDRMDARFEGLGNAIRAA